MASSGSISAPFYRYTLLWTMLASMGVTGLAGCSDDGGQKSSSGVSAEEVCGGTLDESAAQSLRRLSGTNKFSEDSGVSGSESTHDKYSVSWAGGELRRDNSTRVECNIYKTGKRGGELFLGLRFTASDTHPTKESRISAGAAELTTYPIGVFAETEGSKVAILYFECPTKGSDGVDRFINSSIVTGSIEYKSDVIDSDFMKILNSSSRHLAGGMGCADQANLPKRLPTGDTVH